MSQPEPFAGSTNATTYAGLLTQIMSNTLDQDYQVAADRRARLSAEEPPVTTELAGTTEPAGTSGPRTRPHHLLGALVIVLFGVMIGVSALRTEQQRPAAAAERDHLVAQLQLRQHRLDMLHARLSALEGSVASLQNSIGASRTEQRQIDSAIDDIGALTGAAAVSGPGMQITTDNAPGAGESSREGVILDSDLQQLVNALWTAGAEAISINGHRLSTLTAIRSAGRAITVDYRSLTPPYVIDAIGDPATLPARLLETPGGQAWLSLHQNFGIRFDTTPATNLELPADPNTTLHHARPAGGP